MNELEDYSVKRFDIVPIRPGIRVAFDSRFISSIAEETPDYRIFIAANRAFLDKRYSEYRHICSDPDIGDIVFGKGTNWPLWLAAVTTHEYAHLIDMQYHISLPKRYRAYDDRMLFADENGHGPSWQYIYRILRNHYVNSGRYRSLLT